MSGHICDATKKECYNLYDSYGVICVHCNCCGKYGEETMYRARYELELRLIAEQIGNARNPHYQTKLHQRNGAENIKHHAEKLLDAIEHIDFCKVLEVKDGTTQ